MTNNSIAYVREEEAPILPPPPSELGIWGWLYHNGLRSMTNYSSFGAAIVSILMTIMTVGFGLFFVIIVWKFLDFTLFSAVWTDPEGLERDVCNVEGAGACYPFLYKWFPSHIYGNGYFQDQRWRVDIIYFILAVGVVWLVWSKNFGRKFFFGTLIVAALVILAVIIGLPPSLGDVLGAFPTAVSNIFSGNVAAGRWLIFLILGLLVVAFLWNKDPAPKRSWVAIFMLVLFPILAFVFLNGSPVLDGQSFGEFFAQARLFSDENGEGGLNARVLFILIGAIAGAFWWFGRSGRFADFGEAFAPVFGFIAMLFLALSLIPLFAGGLDAGLGLKVVPTAKWGGLLVTLVVALTGIIFSLPIGVLLALGRRSEMPLVKWLCVIFIEVIRGIPLILVLFFASTMLGFFLSEDVNFNKLLRALIGVALFASAYMAEVVRGGLQAVPKGQYEGAMSMGLSYTQMMRLIILPQALTIVIPGIVNTFIGLFKDTTLVLIISIFDLLGIGQYVALSDMSWRFSALNLTEYMFIAVVFWVFCFGMSRYSIAMENRLSRSHH